MLTILAPAKLNLSLDIIGTREDGYHLLRSIMKTIAIYDTIKLKKSDRISLNCNQEEISTEEDNLAYRAATAFFETTGIAGGVSITLEKNIPFGAGLGGGSSDAAATLTGLNQLYQTELSLEELSLCGISIGADVPFFLSGGTALIEGIVERYTQLKNFMPCWFVVVKPAFSVNTPEAYQLFDRLEQVLHPKTDSLINAIMQQDLPSFCQKAGNVLEYAVDMPEISQLKERLRLFGAVYSAMTGSGSAVFGIFVSQKAAESAASNLQKEGVKTFLCH